MSLKILCAFKTEEIFDFVKVSLSKFQIELVKATSESLALFLAQKNYPCLVLCEQELHGGSGMNLLHELKSERDLASIPFVFLTPRPSDSDRVSSFPKAEIPPGAEMFIWYPVESHEFVRLVHRFLEEKEDPREPDTAE